MTLASPCGRPELNIFLYFDIVRASGQCRRSGALWMMMTILSMMVMMALMRWMAMSNMRQLTMMRQAHALKNSHAGSADLLSEALGRTLPW